MGTEESERQILRLTSYAAFVDLTWLRRRLPNGHPACQSLNEAVARADRYWRALVDGARETGEDRVLAIWPPLASPPPLPPPGPDPGATLRALAGLRPLALPRAAGG